MEWPLLAVCNVLDLNVEQPMRISGDGDRASFPTGRYPRIALYSITLGEYIVYFRGVFETETTAAS